MPNHALTGKLAAEDVNGGVFKRVIAPCFENEREIEEHGLIILYAVTA